MVAVAGFYQMRERLSHRLKLRDLFVNRGQMFLCNGLDSNNPKAG